MRGRHVLLVEDNDLNREITEEILKMKGVSFTCAENGQIAYTFTIRNTGAEAVDAAAALVVSDTFDPALKSPISVTLNGDAWPETGNYSYNAATGVFATTAGRITVPAAIYTQDAATGLWTITPGTAVLTVTGTI